MRTNLKYDPEDIESLLLYKKFHELYPEEKAFVLRHIESEKEYKQMRKALLYVVESSSNQAEIDPDPDTKQKIIAVLEKPAPAKPSRRFLLNQLFVFPNWNTRQVLALVALCIGILLITVFVLTNIQDTQREDVLSEQFKSFPPDINDDQSGPGMKKNDAEEVLSDKEETIEEKSPQINDSKNTRGRIDEPEESKIEQEKPTFQFEDIELSREELNKIPPLTMNETTVSEKTDKVYAANDLSQAQKSKNPSRKNESAGKIMSREKSANKASLSRSLGDDKVFLDMLYTTL